MYFDTVDLVVATAIPEPPIISPINNTNITQATPVIIGVAAPLTMVEAVLDNKNILTSKVADDGSWQLAIPSTLSLAKGQHDFVLSVIDAASNRSNPVVLVVNKISAPVSALPIITTPPALRVVPTEII